MNKTKTASGGGNPPAAENSCGERRQRARGALAEIKKIF